MESPGKYLRLGTGKVWRQIESFLFPALPLKSNRYVRCIKCGLKGKLFSVLQKNLIGGESKTAMRFGLIGQSTQSSPTPNMPAFKRSGNHRNGWADKGYSSPALSGVWFKMLLSRSLINARSFKPNRF